jgi:hypothetical protein
MTLAGFLAASPIELVVRRPMTPPSIPARGVVPLGAGDRKFGPEALSPRPPASGVRVDRSDGRFANRVAASVRRRRSPHGGDSADGRANDPEGLRNQLETAARGDLCGREHPRGSQPRGTAEIWGPHLGGLGNAAG